MQQCQVLRYDAIDLVGDVYLVGVELDLVLLNLEVVVDAREVEDTRQVKWVVDIQVDIEQRLVAERIELAVELFVLLLRDIVGLACPERVGVVDDVLLVGIDILAILPLLDLAKGNLYGQESTILFEQLLDFCRLGILEAVLSNVENDGCSAVAALLQLLHLKLGRAVAAPMDSLSSLLPRLSEDLDLVGNHKRRVETQTEVSDDGLILILIEELLGTRECNLVDVFVDLLGGHSDTAVGDGQRLGIFVGSNMNCKAAEFALHDSR